MRAKQETHRSGARQHTGNQNDPSKSSRRHWWFNHPDPVAKFTGWVAAFTMILSSIATIQLITFIKSERAFLSVLPASQNRLAPSQSQTAIHLAIRNSGKSTAIISDMNTTAQIGKGDLPKQREFAYASGKAPYEAPLFQADSITGQQSLLMPVVYHSSSLKKQLTQLTRKRYKFLFSALSTMKMSLALPIGSGCSVIGSLDSV